MATDGAIFLALLVLGAAGLTAGVILYRKAVSAAVRATGGALAAAGVVLLVVVFAYPTSLEEVQSPQPQVTTSGPTNGVSAIDDGGPVQVPVQAVVFGTPVAGGTAITAGSMIPRATSAGDLLDSATLVAIGFVNDTGIELLIGPYGDGGGFPSPVDEDGLPVTDYQVTLEQVMKGRDGLQGSTLITLRMYGHGTDASVLTSVAPFQPAPGGRYLFALGRNPDGTYGSGPEGLIVIDEPTARFGDGLPFGDGVTSEALLESISLLEAP
ncbi:MAG: hypothetical protein O3B84_04060 [Chloroflexi bacterium]|nr:hypothetical protein [Chloroflexota bacterium]